MTRCESTSLGRCCVLSAGHRGIHTDDAPEPSFWGGRIPHGVEPAPAPDFPSMTLGELQRRLETLGAEVEASPHRGGWTVLINRRNVEGNRRIASWTDGANLDEAVRAALAKAES